METFSKNMFKRYRWVREVYSICENMETKIFILQLFETMYCKLELVRKL